MSIIHIHHIFIIYPSYFIYISYIYPRYPDIFHILSDIIRLNGLGFRLQVAPRRASRGLHRSPHGPRLRGRLAVPPHRLDSAGRCEATEPWKQPWGGVGVVKHRKNHGNAMKSAFFHGKIIITYHDYGKIMKNLAFLMGKLTKITW